MAGYLHLFYEDYIGDEGINPHTIINNAKKSIKNIALSQMKLRALESSLVETEFEQLYNIQDHEFANLDVQTGLQTMNTQISSFDDAISKLLQIARDGEEVGDAVDHAIQAIEAIDTILDIGARTGGLGASAYQEVQTGQEKMNWAINHLKYLKFGSGSKKKAKLITELEWVQKNVSGYGLELAVVYAFLIANGYGLQQMISIGGHGEGLDNIIVDDRMKEDLNAIKSALDGADIQSKADTIFNIAYYLANGNGEISITSTWVGFQMKSFQDVSKVPMRVFSLGEIGILNYYTSDFLVNIAGTLAGDQYHANIPSSLKKYKNLGVLQKDVDLLWYKIRASVKILGAIQAISYHGGAGYLDRVHYYVIRSKINGMIRVIPVSEIFDKIIRYYNDEFGGDSLGVTNDATQGYTRSRYWEYNVRAFNNDWSAKERSAHAYVPILDEILNTKIEINLNFSIWF